jgi:hypothetical protein
MSSKTRTRKPRTTATTATTTRALRSVPDQPTTATTRTDTEDKLWAALHTNPNSTAADLSAAATIGKSTAQKILVKWEGDGSVTRTAGIAEGGRRAADLWAIADTAAAPDSTNDGGTDRSTTDDTPADEGTVQDTAPAETVQDEPTTFPADPAPAPAVAAPPADDEPEDAQDPTAAPVPAKTEPADAEPANTEAAGPTEGSPTPGDATETASDGGKTERLAPGALRGQVEDWLREHPDEQAGPTKIAKDLGGKSSGAVSNALDKLVTDGVAVKTQDKPRRFGLAPAQRQAAAPPAN